MSPTKVKELANRKDGDRNACPICAPSPKRFSEDEIWGHCPTNQLHRAADDRASEAVRGVARLYDGRVDRDWQRA